MLEALASVTSLQPAVLRTDGLASITGYLRASLAIPGMSAGRTDSALGSRLTAAEQATRSLSVITAIAIFVAASGQILMAANTLSRSEQPVAVTQRSSARYRHWPFRCCSTPAALLASLWEAGAHDQAAALTDRLPAAGMFGLFLEQQGHEDQFRFGRLADGRPAAPWGWEDLDLT